MEKRNLKDAEPKERYFSPTLQDSQPEIDEGVRELGKLFPFIISGGSNTERFYFTHINDTTKYKFNIRPKYFNDESNYIEAFKKRIEEILKANSDAKIFCVYDWDTIFPKTGNQEKDAKFREKYNKEIENGVITMCPSMPSIEYWFLLHFVNHTSLLKNYSKVSQLLAPYIKPCFPEQNQKNKLKKLLKAEKHLKNPQWVRILCEKGKLETAIKRAETNIQKAEEKNDLINQSFSYVYKIFNSWQ
mgnify:FL=1